MAENLKKIEKTSKETTKQLLHNLGFDLEPDILVNRSFFSPKLDLYEENSMAIKVSGNNLGVLIGFKGETLSSLQLILNLLINSKLKKADRKSWWYVNLDVGGWKQEREEMLVDMAERTVQGVLSSQEPNPLPSMSSSERRIVHVYLSSREGVEQESEGEEPNRRIVVKPK